MIVEGWITTQDIAQGLEGVGHLCPLGLSLTRESGRVTHATMNEVYFVATNDRGVEPRLPLPEYLKVFIRRFDNEETVYPLRYRVEIPE